jgi:glucokinase
MNTYTITFDVGGTFIKAAVLNKKGEITKDTVTVYPAYAEKGKEELLNHLVSLIEQQSAKIIDKSFEIEGVGFAFPGPFNYEKGISYIKGQSKFEHIYGVNLREELIERLQLKKAFQSKMTQDFRIVFENDANLFAMGEMLSGKAKEFEKCICITIGTGTGSAFIDKGELIKGREDVPDNGWIYCQPYRDTTVDEYISKRGILAIAREKGLDQTLDVKELADLARSGDPNVKQLFEQFGSVLGEVLIRFIDLFKPDGLVIGGQIAKCHDLFNPLLQSTLEKYPIKVVYAENTSISTFVGVSKLLSKNA